MKSTMKSTFVVIDENGGLKWFNCATAQHWVLDCQRILWMTARAVIPSKRRWVLQCGDDDYAFITRREAAALLREEGYLEELDREAPDIMAALGLRKPSCNTRLDVRLSTAEMKAWKAAKAATGIKSLNAWLRSVANAAAGYRYYEEEI